MSIWGLLFSFNGRIPRKTYWWTMLTLMVVGMAAMAGAAFHFTGDPLSKVIWLQPVDQINVWGPIWGVYMAVMLWPGLAVTIKRWHDRNRPAWAYLLPYTTFLIPWGRKLTGHGPTSIDLADPNWYTNPALHQPVDQIIGAAIGLIAFYLLIELGFLEGTNGANRYGADPLPPRPAKGWAGFGGRMFGLRGRIGRSGWWYGLLMTFVILIVVLAIGTGLMAFVLPITNPEALKEIGDKMMSDPKWIEAPENMQKLQSIMAAGMLFMVLLIIPFWNIIAISVKRLHDQGRTGAWVLLPITTFFIALVSPSVTALVMMAGSETTPSNPEMIGLVTLGAWGLYGLVVLWCFIQYGMFGSDAGPNRFGEPRA